MERNTDTGILQIHNSDELPVPMTNQFHKVLFRVSFVPPPVRLLQISGQQFASLGSHIRYQDVLKYIQQQLPNDELISSVKLYSP